jgi:hypothetical protein
VDQIKKYIRRAFPSTLVVAASRTAPAPPYQKKKKNERKQQQREKGNKITITSRNHKSPAATLSLLKFLSLRKSDLIFCKL